MKYKGNYVFMDNLNQTWTNLESVYELVRTGLNCGAVAVTLQTLISHQMRPQLSL